MRMYAYTHAYVHTCICDVAAPEDVIMYQHHVPHKRHVAMQCQPYPQAPKLATRSRLAIAVHCTGCRQKGYNRRIIECDPQIWIANVLCRIEFQPNQSFNLGWIATVLLRTASAGAASTKTLFLWLSLPGSNTFQSDVPNNSRCISIGPSLKQGTLLLFNGTNCNVAARGLGG